MENITKKSIKKLSQSAGIKTLSDDCYDVIREIIETKVKEIVKNSSVIMKEDKNSKTLTPLYISQALDISHRETILYEDGV